MSKKSININSVGETELGREENTNEDGGFTAEIGGLLDLQKVRKLIEIKNLYKDLCSEMLATLTLERNQDRFPQELRDSAKRWQAHYEGGM